MSQAEKVFTEIYQGNNWGSSESVSGPGSELYRTRHLQRELPYLLDEFNIRSMLDLPCGDFNWMQHVDLSRVDYIGADIVPQLVERNREKFGQAGRQFVQLDLINTPLPRADAVFCRDCLVHLPLQGIFSALKNICDSGALYLLTSSYSFRGFDANGEIALGEWRRLNLELGPFHFPAPSRYIIEGTDESEGRLSDKVIGVWPIDQIKKRLALI